MAKGRCRVTEMPQRRALHEVANAMAIATRPRDEGRAHYASKKGDTSGVSSMLKLNLKLDRVRKQR